VCSSDLSVVEGISSNSIIDAITISEETVITLTVAKQLKVWSLTNHQLMSSPILLSESADGSWLTSAPAKHLQIVENNRTDKKYLTLFYTSPSTENKSTFQIGAWEIVNRNSNIELDRIRSDHHLKLPAMSYHGTEKSFQNSNWFIQDFQSEVFDDFFLYHILWKSNTSSVLVTYQSHISGELEILYSSFTGPFQHLEELSPNHESDFYKHMIFNSGRYNNLITTTSLNIFKSHYGIDRTMDTNTSIRESMQEAVFKSGNDVKLMWFKLYSLCEEYKKLSEEVLGLSQVNGGSCLATQVNGFGVFRPSHYYEKAFFPRSIESSESKLAQILVKISASVSIKTCHKLVAKATSMSKLSLDGATELYNIYLKSRFSDSGIQAIIGEISLIPDAYKILNSLVQPLNSETAEITHSYKYFQSDDISLINKLFTIGAIRDIKEQHEGLLASLLVLFLLFEVTEDNVGYMNEIIVKLNNYSVFSLILDTSFNSLLLSSHIEAKNLNNEEFSVFWSALVNKHPQLNKLIRENKTNEAFNYIYCDVLANDGEFIVDVIIDLINRGEGKFIREKLFTKLNLSRPIDKFLMGLVYLINEEPQEFFRVFDNDESFNFHTDQTLVNKFKDSLSVNLHIKKFLDAIFAKESNELVRKSNYYNALSELAKSQICSHHRQHHNIHSSQNMVIFGNANLSEIETNYLTIALHFQQVAIELLKQTQVQSLADKIDSYYLNVFDLSMRLSRYDSVYDALSNLPATKETALYNYRELFMRFIKNLINNQSISMIFPPNTNTLYLKNYLLIDNILLTLATNDNNLSRSRKLYEYLYSWRLFGVSSRISSDQLADKRGAIEALYMFICRFRVGTATLLESGTSGIIIDDVKQFKLKILELYMIIINCLKSFDDDDDKWLIKHGESSNSIAKLDDIKLEYLEWIKELEKDLHEL
jgi:nuclear pore complex protein Nup160